MICKACKEKVSILNYGLCYDCYKADISAREAKREAGRNPDHRNRGVWHYDAIEFEYWAWPGVERGEVHKHQARWSNVIYWVAYYDECWLGKFKTLHRAKAWIEEVAPQIDDGEGYDTGPESERGPDWFGNDGIDYREAA